MTALADAIQDLCNAALSGKSPDVAGVAKDYGLNPALLQRKFAESYPNGVKPLPTAAAVFGDKHAETLAAYCKRYGIDPNGRFMRATCKGRSFTILGRLRGNTYLGICKEDGNAYNVRNPKFNT